METSELKLNDASAVNPQSTNNGAERPAAAAVNLQATSKYLQLLSSQRGNVSEGLQQTLNSVQATLNEYVKDPAKAKEASASAAGAEAVYKDLSVKLVERDRNLQEKVAQDLSDSDRLIRSKDAADALSTEMERLPASLSEGTDAGKALAKTVTSSLANLSDHGSMGAGLIRDLAVRGIYVTEDEESLQSRNASEKVLDLSLAYIRANSPETLAAIPAGETPVKASRPGTTTPQIMTRYLRQALDEFPDENTYLDIFRKQAGKTEKSESQDQISKETSQRIHELIAKAAATAKRGNLIPRGMGGSDTAAEPVQTQSVREQIQQSGQKSGESGGKSTSGSGRELSLSELSARASMLQRQFRMERQKLAAEGKLPNPADYPQNADDDGDAVQNTPAQTSDKAGKSAATESTVRTQNESVQNNAKPESARDLTSAEVKITYKAVQSSFYGGIAAVPGMDLPVSDFSSGDIKAFADAAQVSSLTSSRTMSRVLQEQQRLEQAPAPEQNAQTGKSAPDARTPQPSSTAQAATAGTAANQTAGTGTAAAVQSPASTPVEEPPVANTLAPTPAAEDTAVKTDAPKSTVSADPKTAAAAVSVPADDAADVPGENAAQNRNAAAQNSATAATEAKTANAVPQNTASADGAPKVALAEVTIPAAPSTGAVIADEDGIAPTAAVTEETPANSSGTAAEEIAPAASAVTGDTAVPAAAAAPASGETAISAEDFVAAEIPAAIPDESSAVTDEVAPEVAAATVYASQGLSAEPQVQLSAQTQTPEHTAAAAADNRTALASAAQMVNEDERAQNTAAVKAQDAETAAKPQTEQNANNVTSSAPKAVSASILATVPAEELDDADLPADAVKNGATANIGRATAGEINPAAEEAASPVMPQVTVSKTPGAAVITTGSGAPIPDESVVETAPAIKEGGLFHKIASFFGGHADKPETAKTAQTATLTQSMMAAAPQVKGSPLDVFFQALNVAAAAKSLPPAVREQAQKLMHALEDPVADLTSVNNWLSFVAGPMAPDSPRAAAMHGWAFFILCLRFKQLGKSVDKFLKKNGIETALDGVLDDMLLPHQECKDELGRLSSGTLEQLQRLQQLQTENQQIPLPRYIPLPPSYDGGREGGLELTSEDDPKMGKVWHLNFSFDLQGLGPVEIRAVAALPDVRISYVAEKLEGLQAIQAHREELEIELGKLGLNPSSSTPRLGHVANAAATQPEETPGRNDDGALSLKI